MNILLIVLLLLLAFIFYVIGYAGRIQNNKLAQRRKLKKEQTVSSKTRLNYLH